MEMSIRALLPEEWIYTYRQSLQLQGQTGSVGYLRGDCVPFYTTWTDNFRQYKTDEFQADLDAAINVLRFGEHPLLGNTRKMKVCAGQFPDCARQGDRGLEYGLRVDTEKYAYLVRANPSPADYNFLIFCYIRKWLDKHMDRAKGGIRFIDPCYKELFRIPDGRKIVITAYDGKKTEHVCRFIDSAHVEINFGRFDNLFHICEFAERMERIGASYAPAQLESLH